MYKYFVIFIGGIFIVAIVYFGYLNKDVLVSAYNHDGASPKSETPVATTTDNYTPPNVIISTRLSGTYQAENGNSITLYVDGKTHVVYSEEIFDGVWMIDDAGTIRVAQNAETSATIALFDIDESTKSIIEVSDGSRRVYTRSKSK